MESKETMLTNFVRITGVVEYKPKFCYKDNGKIFYETTVTVPRKNSEYKDHIIIILSKKIKRQNFKKDDKVYLSGEIRKYRVPDKTGIVTPKTGIFVFEIDFLNEKDILIPLNEVIMEGIIVEKPFYKEVNNRKFTTLILDVPRRDEHSDYISVFAVEKNAEKLKDLNNYQKIKITEGRIQSRAVPKKGMTFYEVFIKKFEVLE